MPRPYSRRAACTAATVLLWITPLCQAGTRLVCSAEDKQFAWVQRIEIDAERKQAHLNVAWTLPVTTTNTGQLEAIIEDMAQMQDGVPIYAFNAYPQGPTKLTNMFKLFRLAGDWRLAGAAYSDQNGKPVLRAIDAGRPYICRYAR